MNFLLKSVVLVVVALGLSAFANGQTAPKVVPEFSIYGFGRTNFVWDNRNLGQTDLFNPSSIVVGGPKNPTFFIGAKQTRFGFDAEKLLGEQYFSVKLEGDFHNNAANSTGLFRMRHAYAKYKFLLVGMTWSNFFDIGVNPSIVDFEGPNSSTLSRTAQVKFATYKTKNELSISFENPLEDIAINDTVTVMPQRFPDVIGAYKINGNLGFIKVAGLFRELRYETDEVRSLYGYGAAIFAKLKAGKKDEVRFQAVSGTGVAQYIEGVRGLNYDAAYNGTSELDALQITGMFLSYQHHWNEKMHSSATAGWVGVHEDAAITDSDFLQGYYGSINVFWEPIPDLIFGGEAVLGERRNANSNTDTALRLQMNATYKFNKAFNPKQI